MYVSEESRPNGRVMVIGLDGATFDLIEPWAEAGHLPNLAYLMQQGARARLQSTIPAHSGPAWATFATGLHPGQHGVYYFVGPSRDENYFRPLSADSIRGRRFWDLIGDQGRTVGVVNVPLTYPPRPVNGYMIAGLFTPDGPSSFYSPELYEEIVAHCGEYIVSAPLRQDRRAFLNELLKGLANRAQAAEYLIDHHPTDLFLVVFRMIDSVMHRYWVDMDPHHPLHARLGDSAIPDAILSGYRLLDEAVGRLLAKTDTDTTVYLMSDHGFRSEYRRFAANKWLREHGLLKLKSQRASVIGLAEEWAERLHLEMLLKAVSKRVLRLLGVKGRYEGWLYKAVDWPQTRVVFGPNLGFNINLKGRDYAGTVEPEEYEELRDWLIKELKEIHDPETGKPVIQQVYRREEIYQGDALDLASDLIPEMAEYETNGHRWAYSVAPGFSERRSFTLPSWRLAGGHAPDGIFLASGPHIGRGQFPDFSIADLAPTIMYTMGLEVPQTMDGKVRTEIFDPAYAASHPVRYTDLDLRGTDGNGQAMSDDYESAVTERLRGLGYIE